MKPPFQGHIDNLDLPFDVVDVKRQGIILENVKCDDPTFEPRRRLRSLVVAVCTPVAVAAVLCACSSGSSACRRSIFRPYRLSTCRPALGCTAAGFVVLDRGLDLKSGS
ncbi:unnamed protein product [Citrullus colocynthis]|uniref:Uncharacterized protein n=1 Tax=Citrullus colocynthis TaxID=252529 RepID=A0ABP0YA72_9ROSI